MRPNKVKSQVIPSFPIMIGPTKAEVTAQKNTPKFANPTIAGWHVSKAWIKSIGPIDA